MLATAAVLGVAGRAGAQGETTTTTEAGTTTTSAVSSTTSTTATTAVGAPTAGECRAAGEALVLDDVSAADSSVVAVLDGSPPPEAVACAELLGVGADVAHAQVTARRWAVVAATVVALLALLAVSRFGL
jgi:threonine dehydrogenase-like Zn-dependent dehydrogenase